MRVPQQLPTGGATWQLADYTQRAYTSLPAAGGLCTVAVGPVPQGELWLLSRVTVRCNSTADTMCRLYVDDDQDPGNVVDGTESGNFDVADNASPIQLVEGTTLLLVWDSADDGSIGQARLQWTVMRRATS